MFVGTGRRHVDPEHRSHLSMRFVPLGLGCYGARPRGQGVTSTICGWLVLTATARHGTQSEECTERIQPYIELALLAGQCGV